jgi:hypothetical protein
VRDVAHGQLQQAVPAGAGGRARGRADRGLHAAPMPCRRGDTPPGVSPGSPACRAAARGVVLVADSPTIGSSSALRSIPPASARDGIDVRDTP